MPLAEGLVDLGVENVRHLPIPASQEAQRVQRACIPAGGAPHSVCQSRGCKAGQLAYDSAVVDGEKYAEIHDAAAPRSIASGTVLVTPDGNGAWAAVFTANSGRPDAVEPNQVCRLRVAGEAVRGAVVVSISRMTIRLLSPAN